MRYRSAFHRLLIVSLYASLVFSCEREEQLTLQEEPLAFNRDDVSVTMNVDFTDQDLSENSSLTFSNSKDAALIIIRSEAAWEAVSDSDWLRLSAGSAPGGATGILAGAGRNEFVPRQGVITISSGGQTYSITVTQQGAGIISLTAGDVTFKMILVEGGSFTLGDDALYGSTPEHEVTLSSYYICETEVTNSLWYTLMGSLPYDLLEEYEGHSEYSMMNHPLTAATYDEITGDFLPALNALTGLGFRLPTEAEWEYAALGGKYSQGYDYAGSNTLDDVGWYDWNAGGRKHEVQQKQPNELGLYDMSGNVSEWCSDWYSYYYTTDVSQNPTGPETGGDKVVRGGNYESTVLFDVGECGVKYRAYTIPDCFDGCWGNTGHPEEPICFFCKTIGFRFVLPVI